MIKRKRCAGPFHLVVKWPSRKWGHFAIFPSLEEAREESVFLRVKGCRTAILDDREHNIQRIIWIANNS